MEERTGRRPFQERWARQLHQEAGVPKGPCGYEELQQFQKYLGPQGHQIIVVEPSKFLIVFKDVAYNDAPHVIGLVKHQGHYDCLTSIPALLNRSYYCRHCDAGYDHENAEHHNCQGTTVLPAAAEIRPAPIMPLESNPPWSVLNVIVNFMVKIVLMPTRSKKRRKGPQAFVKVGENV